MPTLFWTDRGGFGVYLFIIDAYSLWIRNYKNVCMDIGDSQSSDSGAVRVPSARKQAAIHRKQFLQSMANNMQSRLYTTMASKVSTSCKAQTDKQNSNDFTELISQVYYCFMPISLEQFT